MKEPQTPWEDDADRFGVGAAKLLCQMRPEWRASAIAVLEASIALQDDELQRLTKLIGFHGAMLDFWEKGRPSIYQKTRAHRAWAQRCIDLKSTGVSDMDAAKRATEAYNRTEVGGLCVVPEFAGCLRPAPHPRSNTYAGRANVRSVRRWIQNEEARLDRGEKTSRV